MIRNACALALLGLAALVIAMTVRPSSDAAAIFGPGGAELASLDTPAGREVIVALEHADVTTRNGAARVLAAMLADEPLVAAVRSGPIAPSKAFQDWLWLHRFQLSPPAPDAFEPDRMAARLEAARALMTSAEGIALADRQLRDPTGSYAALVQRIAAGSGQIGRQGGIWQSKDNAAALLFVTLVDQPFVANETHALARRIRALGEAEGVTVHLLGPRVISAEISAETARASTIAGGLAGVLLLVWLVWSLRSIKALALVLLPLCLGIAAATLAVQVAFGSVHVIALGFGGALTGLALDYPLHLLGHEKPERGRAARLVLIGAATTGVGFLAMLGSGVPALMQTGVFIACGLLVAAIAARMLLREQNFQPRSLPLERLRWRMPFKPYLEGAVAFAGLVVLLVGGAGAPQSLFAPPDSVTASIERMRQMVDLPSGRYALRVSGETLDALLARQAALMPSLDRAIEEGALRDYTMLAKVLGGAQGAMADPAVFTANAGAALHAVGMAPDFVKAQEAAYRAALAAPPLAYEDLSGFPETRALVARLQRSSAGWTEHVGLIGLSNPAALTGIAPEANAELVDLVAPIEDGLAALRGQVTLWLGLGALAAFACLAVGLQSAVRAFQIARASCAALGLTLLALALTSGPPGIFQIVALTLVVGIGIDYGLFLRGAEDEVQRRAACRSVALCAGSTLIAFAVMALSPVKLLHEIGLTVSIGVIAMLILNLADPHRNET